VERKTAANRSFETVTLNLKNVPNFVRWQLQSGYNPKVRLPGISKKLNGWSMRPAIIAGMMISMN